jgi:hypothetical protein
VTIATVFVLARGAKRIVAAHETEPPWDEAMHVTRQPNKEKWTTNAKSNLSKCYSPLHLINGRRH